jgi:hypothetical protein
MTNKIPVGRTIARGYRFAFRNIVNNLGAIWLPAVILLACSYFFLRPYTTQLVSGDPQVLPHILPQFLLFFVAVMVLISCQMAALTKEALRLRIGNAFLQNPFGAPAWRLLAAYLLYILAMIAIYVAILIVAMIGGLILGLLASSLSPVSGKLVVGLVALLAAIVIGCAVTYIATRLSFLLAPVCVAEQRITLIRGWELTRGNFWRIFVVMLGVLIPILIVELVYIYAVYGGNLLPPMGQAATPEAMAQFQQHQQQLMIAASERTQHYWYLTYPLGLLFAVVMYGLFAGISAFAYQELAASDSGERSGWFAQWTARSSATGSTTPRE